ncbi:HIT-like protein [Crucibulum laeve]|uniref:HIT-like protein n=1 Tax=Crucibulum laeve TaxID=68775 RepID=A0A5C3M7N7_9AGAR|nr:HIT-like protein [Crucibulum laeve]
MTSFIIKSHVGREPAPSWKQDLTCPFCRIIDNELPSNKVYEDDHVIAFLDIMPLRRGHTLVVPKPHISRLSELPPEFAAATGVAVSKIARALTEALDNTGLNVVCNQEYAQAVPHVHYHIIPAPVFGASAPTSIENTDDAVGGRAPLTRREMHQKEFEAREELDDDEAEELVAKIRARL